MIRCYVTDRRSGNLEAGVRRAVDSGVDLIQIREKDLSAAELLNLALHVRDLASSSSTRILVSDRLDIALAANLDGVHLPGNGLPADLVRPYVRVLGVSTHTAAEAGAAEKAGANFAFFGPVFATPGKSPVGLDSLRRVAEAVRIPILAIGGITVENAPSVLDAGAAGFAAIRMFQQER